MFAEHMGVPEILGSVSSYLPNRNYGDALPGLLQAQDVTSLHETLKQIRSLDEGRREARTG